MTAPTFTILTACFNRAGMIADAIESVLAQNAGEVEHIVIDGGSTDGTLDVLKNYPHLKVISEPDEGMYDALNKGLRLARGGIIGLLNSDDTLAPGCLRAVREAFDRNPDAQAVAGGGMYVQDGRVLRELGAPDLRHFWFHVGRNDYSFPNTWFLRRAAYDRVGEFDAGYRYTADWDMLIRMALAGVRPATVAQTLYVYGWHAGSATYNPTDSRDPSAAAMIQKVYDELLRVVETHLARPGLPAELRRGLRQGMRRYAYRMAAVALYHRRWRDAARTASRAVRVDPLWPLAFLYLSARRALKAVFPALPIRD